MGEREHGYARYRLDGCRCYTCGWARSQYDDNRTRAIIAGTWQPFVDAEPVRQHIRTLQSCSMGLRQIAAAAKVDRKRLQAILTGRPERGTPPQKQVRPALAAAVLAVEVTLDGLGGATPISSLTTLRRLHALVAAGWPQHHLAIRMAMTDGNFATLLCRSQVTVRVARAVRDLYAELENQDPREHGISEHSAARARNHARAKRWAPTTAWDPDTLDDPAAIAEWTGRCGSFEGYGLHKRNNIPTCAPCRAAQVAHRHELRAAAAS